MEGVDEKGGMVGRVKAHGELACSDQLDLIRGERKLGCEDSMPSTAVIGAIMTASSVLREPCTLRDGVASLSRAFTAFETRYSVSL